MTGRFGVVVGRDGELARLERIAERSRAGTGSAALVVGPAGIGKTTLVTELVRRCEHAGDTVIWARCSNDPGAPHHWAWMQVLRAAVQRVSEDRLADRLGSSIGHLLQAVPGLPLDHEPPTSGPGEHAPPGQTGSDLFGFYDAALVTLREAATAPLVVVIEDLHWADHSTVRLVELVARSLHDVPLTLIGTLRDLEAAVDPALSTALDLVARVAEAVPLPGLSPRSVRELVAHRTGGPCPLPHAEALHRLTAGNPFLLDDAVHLFDTGDATAEDRQLPRSLLGTARAAFGRLAPAEQTILAGAAVIGVDFATHAVAEVVQQTIDETASTLGRLAERGVIRPMAGADRWSFSHELLRDAALAESDDDVRSRWHLRAAELVRDAGSHGEVAAHLLAAGTRADPADVAHACRIAGREATSRLAHAEAVRWIETGLDHLYRSTTSDDEQRLTMLLMLGDAQMRAGRATAALDTFERARTLANHRGDSVAFARAAAGTAEARRRGPGWESRLDDLRPLLSDALQRLDADADPVLRARLHGHLCAGAAMASDHDVAQQHADEAAAVAAGTDDLVARHAALVAQRWATIGPAPLADKASLTDQLAFLAVQTDDPYGQWWAARWRLHDGLEAGDPERIATALATSTTLADRIGEPDLVVDTLVQQGTVALLEGRFDQLRELHEEAREMAERWEIGQEPILGQELFASRERGDLRIDVLRMILDANPLPIYRALMCWGAVSLGRVEDARAELDRFFDEIDLEQLGGVYRPALLAMLSEAAVLLEDVERAQLLELHLRPLAEQCVVAGIGPYVWTGSAHHYLGMLATVTGGHDRARRHLDEARRVHQRMGARPWVLRTELAQARLDVASGRRDTGAAQAARISQEAETLGLHALVAEAARMEPPPAPRPSSSEAEWRLVEEGATWLLETPAGTHRLRHRKGLSHLRTLLQRPGTEVHVLELAGGGAPQAGTGPVLDEDAKRAYRLRVEDLRDQIDEGERWGDAERTGRAQDELDALARELAGAVGLGGRDRTSGDAGERARVAVTKALRSAIDSVAEAAPEVGTHLAATLRTGSYCCYQPDPAAPVRWVLA